MHYCNLEALDQRCHSLLVRLGLHYDTNQILGILRRKSFSFITVVLTWSGVVEKRSGWREVPCTHDMLALSLVIWNAPPCRIFKFFQVRSPLFSMLLSNLLFFFFLCCLVILVHISLPIHLVPLFLLGSLNIGAHYLFIIFLLYIFFYFLSLFFSCHVHLRASPWAGGHILSLSGLYFTHMSWEVKQFFLVVLLFLLCTYFCMFWYMMYIVLCI